MENSIQSGRQQDLILNDHPAEKNLRKRITAEKVPNYRIEEIKALGNNQALTDYLRNLGIWDIANETLREIYYYIWINNEKKHFFSVGWQNETGGWEIRNKYYSGCLGERKLTYIPANHRCLVVFEFYFNYLTWRRYYPGSTHSIIVLNTLDALDKAIGISGSYPLVQLYFSHKESGRMATKTFISTITHAVDRSVEYKKYKDYNDKLVAELRAFGLLQNSPLKTPER